MLNFMNDTVNASPTTFRIKELSGDRRYLSRLLMKHWGTHLIVTRGKIHDASKLPGFVALRGREIVGVITFNIESDQSEIVTLNSSIQGIGIGTALLKAAEKEAVKQNCTRLWLITTNDNQPALGFYQHRGFKVAAIHHGAIIESRKLKPEIPFYGIDGIPIEDEIELDVELPRQPSSIDQ